MHAVILVFSTSDRPVSENFFYRTCQFLAICSWLSSDQDIVITYVNCINVVAALTWPIVDGLFLLLWKIESVSNNLIFAFGRSVFNLLLFCSFGRSRCLLLALYSREFWPSVNFHISLIKRYLSAVDVILDLIEPVFISLNFIKAFLSIRIHKIGPNLKFPMVFGFARNVYSTFIATIGSCNLPSSSTSVCL